MNEARTVDRTITLDRLMELLDTYGADPRRWPASERKAALALLERSAEARTRRDQAARLDGLLDLLPAGEPSAELESRLLDRCVDREAQGRRRARFARYAGSLGVPLAAAAVLTLWLTLSNPERPPSPTIAHIEERESLLPAFVDPDETELEPARFLPESYLAMAEAFEVPVGE